MFPVLCVIFLLALWIVSQHRVKECFPNEVIPYNVDLEDTNKGTEPWTRHRIESSLPTDIVAKYPYTYFYEHDNLKYERILRQVFGYPCSKGKDLLKVVNWKIIDLEGGELNINVAYDAVLQNITDKLNSTTALDLPQDNPNSRPRIQVVHDRLLQARTHTQKEYYYAFDMEIILYREAKFNGKHVRLTCLAEYNAERKKWEVNVVELELVGIVYEDQIALFPVNAYQPNSMKYLPVSDMSSTRLIDETTITKVVDQQSRLQKQDAAASKALLSQMPS